MASPRPKILLLGDSLTQLSFDPHGGWGAVLAHVYQRRADVLNRGMSGYNTEWFLHYLEHNEADILVDGVALVTIFFGANDASDEASNPHHHVPLHRYKSNLKTLIQKCQDRYGPSIPIVVLTPPPVQHEQRLEYQRERYGAQATGILERTLELSGQYAEAAEEAARENQVACVTLWKDMQQQQEQDWHGFFYDGLHFTQAGNTFVAESLLATIAKVYPDLVVTADPLTKQWANSASSCLKLSQNGPYHDEIDESNPGASFQDHYCSN